jgi:hypothetical protein
MNYDVDMKVSTIHGATEAPEVAEGHDPIPCDCTIVLTRGGDKVELNVNDYDIATAFAATIEGDNTVTVTFSL